MNDEEVSGAVGFGIIIFIVGLILGIMVVDSGTGVLSEEVLDKVCKSLTEDNASTYLEQGVGVEWELVCETATEEIVFYQEKQEPIEIKKPRRLANNAEDM